MKKVLLLAFLLPGFVFLTNCKKSYSCEQVSEHTLTVFADAFGAPAPSQEKIDEMAAKCDQDKLDSTDSEALDCFMNANTMAELKECKQFDM